MVTDGLQDDVMGEETSRVELQHTCRLMDALFLALSKSEQYDFDLIFTTIMATPLMQVMWSWAGH